MLPSRGCPQGGSMNKIYLCVALLLLATTASARLPNKERTPGVTNPEVTQNTIHQTICVPGWTATIRPPSSYTTNLNRDQIKGVSLQGEAAIGVRGEPPDQPAAQRPSAGPEDLVAAALPDQMRRTSQGPLGDKAQANGVRGEANSRGSAESDRNQLDGSPPTSDTSTRMGVRSRREIGADFGDASLLRP